MKNKPFRILHVLNYSLPYISGYCTRSQYILEAQKRAGLEVAAVTSPRHQEITPDSPEAEAINGIKYFRTIPKTKLPKRKSSISRARSFIAELEDRIKEVAAGFNPSILHAHSPSLCGLSALRAAGSLGIPLVYEVRALWEDAAVDQKLMSRTSWKYLLSRLVETRLLKRTSKIVVLCSSLKKEFADRVKDPGKIHVVPNGVDFNHFRPLEKNIELALSLGVEKSMVVGFIGTFFKFEGLDDLLRAWDIIAEAVPEAKLLLVGHGELMDELQALRNNSKYKDSIILLGRVEHDKVLDFYSIMDIMLYPRKSVRLTELVTPLKPLEAMAMGKALIASDVGGLKEIVKEGETGLIFRAGDSDELADKVLHLIENPEQRAKLGQNALAYVARERGWNEIVKLYDEVYRSA